MDTLVSEGFSASLFGLNKEHLLVFKTARSQTDLPAAFAAAHRVRRCVK